MDAADYAPIEAMRRVTQSLPVGSGGITMVTRSTFRIALALVAFSVVAVHETTAQGSNPPGLCKAGTAAFGIGQAGIVVTYPVPWPAAVKYSVVVQPTNTAGYSPATICTYFNVLKKTPTKFEVQHKRCNDGVPLALDVAVSLDWIACPHQ
jgi:hypothetical protein